MFLSRTLFRTASRFSVNPTAMRAFSTETTSEVAA